MTTEPRSEREDWNPAVAYDAIADWYAVVRSDQGLAQLDAALERLGGRGAALDLGCGCGRPLLRRLATAGFAQLTGVDCSAAMLAQAARTVPAAALVRSDLRTWQGAPPYDLILAWDSLFHIPAGEHVSLLARWSSWLAPGGELLVSVGGIAGERSGTMQGHAFAYWSLDRAAYLVALRCAGLEEIVTEHDQPGEEHLVLRARCGTMRGYDHR